MDEQEAIQRFLGERPGARELREWRETLQQRLASLTRDRNQGSAGAAAALELKIAQLQRQIAALQEEEAVTQFVEDSVRVTLAMGASSDGMESEE